MSVDLTFVTPDLALGGSFPAALVPHLAQELGLRAVIDLRSEDRDDEALLAEHGIAFLHLPTPDHHALTPAMIGEGVAFARSRVERGEKVLIHCAHGIGRSATLGLCVLVAGGLAPLDALELAKSRRDRVSPSPAQYHAWVTWLALQRTQATPAWEIPDFESFASIAYRHLRTGP
jgi:protein-tyrosine phosphatase